MPELICAHISDIHWRGGIDRHDEYRWSFDKCFDILKRLSVNSICLTGDIVHSKTRGITPELIENLTWWFREMGRIAPVTVTLGNHDGLIHNSDRQDAITPIIEAMNDPRIQLYKKSGIYPVPGLENEFAWGVFSCFDVPGWDQVILDAAASKKTNIAIYHGSVAGVMSDNDWMLDSTVKIDDFASFDYGMFGDIHRQQFLTHDKKFGYAGSAIQQNYGEMPEKGFLLWKIKDKNVFDVEFVKIPHRNPFITVDWDGSILNLQKNIRTLPESVVTDASPRFRVRSTIPMQHTTVQEITKTLKGEHSALEIVFKDDSMNVVERSLSMKLSNSEHDERLDLKQSDSLYTIMRGMYDDQDLSDDQWKFIQDSIERHIREVSKEDTQISRGMKWSLNQIEFDNVFSYGSGNVIDFSTKSGLVGIFGKNRLGKSSVAGAIMYCLFNSSDRGSLRNQDIINSRYDNCRAKAVITLDDKTVSVERRSVKTYNSSGDVGSLTYLTLSEIDPETGSVIRDLSGEQRKDSDKILREMIGTADDFLLMGLSAQDDLMSICKMGSSKRKSMIIKFLGLDFFDKLYDNVRNDGLSIKSQVSKYEKVNWDDIIDKKRIAKDQLYSRRAEILSEIETASSRLQNLRNSLASSADNNLVTPSDVEKAKIRVSSLRDSVEKINVDVDVINEEISVINVEIDTIDKKMSEYDIMNLNNRMLEGQTAKSLCDDLIHEIEKEKIRVKNLQKESNLLNRIPCGDKFPSCVYVVSAKSSKQNFESQKNSLRDKSSLLRKIKKDLASLLLGDVEEKLRENADLSEKKKIIILEKSEKERYRLDLQQKIKSLYDALEQSIDTVRDLEYRTVTEDRAKLVDEFKKEIRTIEAKLSRLDDEKISISESLGKISSELQQCLDNKIEHAQLSSNLSCYQVMMEAFSKKGIPLKVISSKIPVINREIERILCGTTGFTVVLEVPDKSNDLDIFIDYGDSRRPIETSSGMEKMMSSIALRVALSNISLLPKPNFLIIDEGFGSLDEINAESCSQFLGFLKQWFSIVFIISHVDLIKESVDSIIEITRRGLDSYVFDKF